MKRIVKLIDYNFQHRHQLTEAYDDSNSMRHLNPAFRIEVIGRFEVSRPEHHWVRCSTPEEVTYLVTFLPTKWGYSDVINYIFSLNPDVIHMHGTSAWPQYPIYAEHFAEWMPDTKLIFSPAGDCHGPLEFLGRFDVVIVNHPDQIKRMKCDSKKIIVRRRSADPTMFKPVESKPGYDFVYVSGFIPQKRIDLMIDTVSFMDFSLVILGDFTRRTDHYRQIERMIKERRLQDQIFLHDFIPQTEMSEFLSHCKIWVWPNIKPENVETTTNRSVIEALACGKPLLLGSRAFKNTEYLITGFNGYKYSGPKDFVHKAMLIMTSLKQYGGNSFKLSENHFRFDRNFIDFYNKLYGK